MAWRKLHGGFIINFDYVFFFTSLVRGMNDGAMATYRQQRPKLKNITDSFSYITFVRASKSTNKDKES